MNDRIRWAAIAALVSGAASAQDGAPLSADELGRCAERVRELRSESPRLNALSERLEARRSVINAKSGHLKAEAAQLNKDDLDTGIALHSRRQAHNEQASQFNTEIAQFRSQVNALNGIKADYDRECANRPYRRSDLARLPPPAQQAMRAGLDGVVVPYIDNRTLASEP